jgi:DNA-binding SARP family transcriptional activator
LALDDDFRLWLERQRRADQQAQREPVAAALACAEQAGDLDAALAHARQLLTLDVSDEGPSPGADARALPAR